MAQGLSFIFDAQKGETPASIAQKRALVAQIMGSQNAPSTLGAGFSALGDGIVANVTGRRADEAQEAGQSQVDAFRQMLTGGSAPSIGTGGAPGSVPSGGSNSYRDAIASIESAGSGDYSAVGPTNSSLGRALGRYQVMEANIGPWSKAALGREISPDEFLANPQLQDQIFDHQFGSYVDQFGPQGAAQAWFAGPGGVGKGDRQDVLGTSVSDYTNKFTNALGAGGGQLPMNMPPQQAQLPPIASGGPQPIQAPQQATAPQAEDSGLSLEQLIAQSGNPFVMERFGPAINAMIQQKMQQQDPAYQQSLRAGDLGIQKSELELDAMRHPPAPAPAPVKYEVIGGQVVAIDPNSNSASSIGSFGQPATAPRPMTSEDRAMWGIPASDTTPYYLDENGQPKAIGGGGQTINVGQGEIGSIPPDYELITDPVTGARSMQIIPGSPSDRKAQADAASAQSTADANQNQASRYGNVVVEDIDRALGVLAKDPTWSTGLLGQAMGNFKGSNSDRLNNLLDTVRANSAFDRLQAMRNASPTGGALGAVSERELGLLQSAIGSLETGNADDLAYNLKRLQTIYSDIIDGPKASTTPAQAQPGDIDSLLQKYGVP